MSAPTLATPPQPAFIRAAELARLLGVDLKTIRNWLKAGRLPPPIIQTRRATYWNRSVMMRFIEEGAPNG